MNQIQKFKYSPAKASKIIGRNVVTSMREKLGEIKEIMLDPVSGRIAYAVVCFEIPLGLGDKLFALPFTTLIYDYDEDEFILSVPKEDLKNAPSFEPSDWPSMAQEQWNRDIYRFYDKQPYWEM